MIQYRVIGRSKPGRRCHWHLQRGAFFNLGTALPSRCSLREDLGRSRKIKRLRGAVASCLTGGACGDELDPLFSCLVDEAGGIVPCR